MPIIRNRAVVKAKSVDQALAMMLRGSGYHAVKISSAVYRIEAVSAAERKPFRHQNIAPTDGKGEAENETATIVVTGQKRSQKLGTLPVSVALISLQNDVGARALVGGRDVALAVDGLAMTNLGSGRNRQFIRGVADSPFSGPSQSTVAIVLDGARLTFDAPDPDLRLADMERVEILKGPQGPLYGSGALGGIYHLVPQKPDAKRLAASVRFSSQLVGDALGAGTEGMINLPLREDKVALRAVAYADRRAGWIDIENGSHNANTSWTRGGRLALRWEASPTWVVNLGAVGQATRVDDAQYVSVSGDDADHERPMKEPSHSRFSSAYARIEGSLGRLNLVSSSSFAGQHLGSSFDASAVAGQFGIDASANYRSANRYEVINQELRITPSPDGPWLVGLSYLKASSHAAGDLILGDGATQRVESLDRTTTELAFFGEVKVPLLPRLDATVGGRGFRTVGHDEARAEAGIRSASETKLAFSPSAALSWRPGADDIVFLRYARAIRPGGLSPLGQGDRDRFASDELGTIELAARFKQSGTATFSASIFRTDWHNVQSDYLLDNGIVSTRNAGNGRIAGAEVSMDWSLQPAFSISSGLTLLDARLVHPSSAEQAEDRRLPVVPWLSARLGMRWTFRLNEWQGQLGTQANYTGRSRLSFDEQLDRRMGGYFQLAGRIAFDRGPLRLSLSVDNILNGEADTFAFGNPFSIRRNRQYTPLRPRTFSLSIARQW